MSRGPYKTRTSAATELGRWRVAKGFTQAQAARYLAVSLRTYQRLELQEHVLPSMRALVHRRAGI